MALRPLAPGLLAAWLVCFLTALHEVTMSSLLYGPGTETLAVVVLNSADWARSGTAALRCWSRWWCGPGAAVWWLVRRLGLASRQPLDAG